MNLIPDRIYYARRWEDRRVLIFKYRDATQNNVRGYAVKEVTGKDKRVIIFCSIMKEKYTFEILPESFTLDQFKSNTPFNESKGQSKTTNT